jgi:hypothetical protein
MVQLLIADLLFRILKTKAEREKLYHARPGCD